MSRHFLACLTCHTFTVPQTLKHYFRFSLFFFYPLCICSNTGAKTKASVADSCSKPAQAARHHACPAHIRLPCFKLPILRYYNWPRLVQEEFLQRTESIICTTVRSRQSQTRRMKVDATQVAQRAADPTGFRNAQFSTSRRARNSWPQFNASSQRP